MLIRQIMAQAPEAGPIIVAQNRVHVLEAIVKDTIPDRAFKLRDALCDLLLPLLVTNPVNNDRWMANVCRVIPYLEPPPQPAVLEAEWKRHWNSEIYSIFKEALKLRLSLDKEGGKYTFDFPRPGSQMRLLDQHDQPLEKGVVIQLSLLPCIKGTFRAVHGGPFGEAVILSPPEVEVLAPYLASNDTGESSKGPLVACSSLTNDE